MSGLNLVKTESEYKTSITLYLILEELTRKEESNLIGWLASRSVNAPSTPADKVILFALANKFKSPNLQYWQSVGGQWKALLSAKNPVYRLLALQNAHMFETEPALLLISEG